MAASNASCYSPSDYSTIPSSITLDTSDYSDSFHLSSQDYIHYIHRARNIPTPPLPSTPAGVHTLELSSITVQTQLHVGPDSPIGGPLTSTFLQEYDPVSRIYPDSHMYPVSPPTDSEMLYFVQVSDLDSMIVHQSCPSQVLEDGDPRGTYDSQVTCDFQRTSGYSSNNLTSTRSRSTFKQPRCPAPSFVSSMTSGFTEPLAPNNSLNTASSRATSPERGAPASSRPPCDGKEATPGLKPKKKDHSPAKDQQDSLCSIEGERTCLDSDATTFMEVPLCRRGVVVISTKSSSHKTIAKKLKSFGKHFKSRGSSLQTLAVL